MIDRCRRRQRVRTDLGHGTMVKDVQSRADAHSQRCNWVDSCQPPNVQPTVVCPYHLFLLSFVSISVYRTILTDNLTFLRSHDLPPSPLAWPLCSGVRGSSLPAGAGSSPTSILYPVHYRKKGHKGACKDPYARSFRLRENSDGTDEGKGTWCSVVENAESRSSGVDASV
jgi:hypothetical protein